MGSARSVVAAAAAQYADEHGISWPRALAPFAVHLVSVGSPGTPEREACERVYETLTGGGIEVLYDDRDGGPGEKFADAELLGCPLRLTVGRRSLDSGEIEVQLRRGREPGTPLPLGAGTGSPSGWWTSCGRGLLAPRRLLGLDRSGAPPPETLAGQPLRVWTLPNAIGFVRLALIPVFLAVEFSSSDGTSALGATLFAVIGFGDYLDGITARLTGQYSRLGTLLDPITDRVLVVAGVVVCWHFHLLPRWALALLAARELAMVLFARYGQTHGVSAHQPGLGGSPLRPG
jgi:cardiolipin synthase